MTKQEAIKDARIYANMLPTGQTVYVQRRGDKYKASVLLFKGWTVAEMFSYGDGKVVSA
jgi:hypothetical protein